MANPISGVSTAQQAAQIQAAQTTQTKQAPKQQQNNAVPQDTVTISNAGRAAQAQPVTQTQKTSADADHNGDTK
jgi:hypothetical protein